MIETGDSAGAARPGFWRSFAHRVRSAFPPAGQALLGALLWAVLMAASAAFGIWLRDWQTPDSLLDVVILFGFGGAVAFPIGLFVARFFALGQRREAAFAAAFLSFSVVTVGVTALAFALVYRSYYAEWHEEFLTITWAFQLFFTTAAALAQFAVLGIRLFFPLGFIALFAASLWFSLKHRAEKWR